MSDYLWDKTGEPDAELERLETLLGTLAHQPRALELPATARVARAARAAPFFRARAPRPALAIAAALALMLLAGAWLVAARRAAGASHAAALSANVHNLKVMQHKLRSMQPSSDNKETPAERPSRQQTAHVAAEPRRERAARTSVAGLGRRKRGDASARDEAPKAGLLEVVMERQQTAKEQLVYALRLTGAKLNEVQTKVRGAGEERPAGEVRNKIK